MRKHKSTDEMLMLGMALYADKKTMEQRVRGVFARRQTARGARICALMLMLVLMLGCFTTACQPQATQAGGTAPEQGQATEAPDTPESIGQMIVDGSEFAHNLPSGADDEIVVSNVDEFLSALGPNRTIYMKKGDYLLTDAADYGLMVMSPYYSWLEVGDGFELAIYDAENLKITGERADLVNVYATPRYANVLSFFNGGNVMLQGVTMGHTEAPGVCSGGVLNLENLAGYTVSESVLFGCGTLGVNAIDTQNVTVTNCTIKECSLGALNVVRSYNVQLQDSRIRACGEGNELPAESLVYASQSDSVALVNCEVTENTSRCLLTANYSRDVRLLGCNVSNNDFSEYMFAAAQYAPIVEGSAFSGNTMLGWYAEQVEGSLGVAPVAEDGSALLGEALGSMALREMTYAGPITPAAQTADAENGMREVHASTVDEFLAAISSNTTVYLAASAFDLTVASNYGAYGAGGYYWLDQFDGPGLVIANVENFHIVGEGADATSIRALPRYADVLAFENCQNVSVTGVTLGHFEEPGECMGGVLRFQMTDTVLVRECGLFGCGILGVDATQCSNMTIVDTEIYDCSEGAVRLYACSGVAFENCDIHDCGEPTFQIEGCDLVTIDGEAFAG